MHRPLTALAVVLLALPAFAQDSTSRSGTFLLGVGRDLRAGSSSSEAPSALLIGYERALANSRLGLRLSAEYSSGSRGSTYASTEYVSSSFSTVRTASAGLSLTYALTRSRVHPYLLGGVGVQNTRQHADLLFAQSTESGNPSAPLGPLSIQSFSAARWNPYVQFGGGVAARFRGVTLFSEAKFLTDPRVVVGGATGYGVSLAPITFGVRFD